MAAIGDKRIFTYAEARRLVPTVRERTRTALDHLTTARPPRTEEQDDEAYRDSVREAAEEVLAAWVREMEGLGLEVKGPWLVDFDSGAGYYCWKWPEESLEFFHGYEEGFAGRVRLQ